MPKKEIKKIGMNITFSWLFSIILLLVGFGVLFANWINGILLLISGVIILPPFNKMLKKKYKIELSRDLKIFVVVVLVIATIIIGSVSNNDSSSYVGENIQDMDLNTQNVKCSTNWQCLAWSECSSSGMQIRTCSDSNNCGDNQDKPLESRSCTYNYKIGDQVIVEYIAFTVNKVTKQSKVGEYIAGTLFGDEANGIFYVVDLTLENKAKESKDFYVESFKIVDNQGRSFDSDIEAEIYYEEGNKRALLFSEQLQPDLPITGVKIFDLPLTAEGLKLEISCCGLLTETTYIDLGL